MPSFRVYIDESGCDGFVFKDWPERASSEWFVLSACVIAESRSSEASQKLHDLLDPIEKNRRSLVHFHKLYHEQRVAIAHGLAKIPMRTVSICVNKRMLTGNHTLIGKRRLYFYCTRYLLERVSWIARDYRGKLEEDKRARLYFSACKGMSYDDMRAYLVRLKLQQTSIEWSYLDTDLFKIQGHSESMWLRAADCVSTSFARALELSEHGFCEDRYARLLRPIVYAYQDRRRIGYGLKIFPATPPVEKERDNRYEWLSLYR